MQKILRSIIKYAARGGVLPLTNRSELKKFNLGTGHPIMHAIRQHPDRSLVSISEKFTIRAAFILLFPGFFFYQTLLGTGVISAFLGGYFTFVTLIFTLPLIFFYSVALKKNKGYFSKFDAYIVFFIIYCILVLAFNFSAGASSSITQRYVLSFLFFFDTYIIFRMIDFNDKKFFAFAMLSLLIMSAITVRFSIDGFFYLQALGEATNPDSLATYQGFARSYIYTFFIIISIAKSIGARFLLYGIASVSLFLNGARSEFSAVLFSIPIIELYYAKHKLYLIISFALLLILFGVNMQSVVGMLPDNRTAQLFDLSNSSSAVARQQLASNAWRTIIENPVFGDFASYQNGHYAHNILSAWVDFGLSGFLFFAALLLWPAFRLFSDGYFLKAKSCDFVLACTFICIAILWALTAKNVPDMSVGAALGAFAKYRYGKKHDQVSLPYGRLSAQTRIHLINPGHEYVP